MYTKRYHHIFDLTNCNNQIANKAVMEEFLKELASSIEMNIIEGPIIADGLEHNPGLSAIAIVDFSHMSIHTFTNNNEALIDVFSCKEYDRSKALRVCQKFFGAPETTVREKEVFWG